jgi:CubicO group peptidase (beta-lactamase class C family)
MDSAQLLAALDYIERNGIRADSLTVIRNGHMVLDAYYYPYTPETQRQIWSATKSFTATLAAIAIEQGLIAGLDQPVLDLFPDRTIAELDEDKQALTVGNLLTMSSGFDCLDGGLGTFAAMLDRPEGVQEILDLPMYTPGQSFEYCDLNSQLLAAATGSAVQQPLLDYADAELFGPLGITDYTWTTYPDGVPFGFAGLYLTPQDMARLGYLYLRHGEWDGQQVVSPAWVDLATCADPAQCPFYQLPRGPLGYGYHWWILQPNYYIALGLGGQFVAAAPEKDLVIVLTGSGGDEDTFLAQYGLLDPTLLNAVVSDEPLPANPKAYAALEARVQALAQPQPQEIPPVPEQAAPINGVECDLEEPLQLSFEPAPLAEYLFGAPMDLVSFRLNFDDSAQAVLDLTFGDGETVRVPVGLDGVPRMADTRMGVVASKGQWLPRGQGFGVAVDMVGQSTLQLISFRFRDEGIRVIWNDPAWDVSESVDAVPAPAS